MPRRNRQPKQPQRYPALRDQQSKTRYISRSAAVRAANEQMKYHLDLVLNVYQASDGGWYLTSSTII